MGYNKKDMSEKITNQVNRVSAVSKKATEQKNRAVVLVYASAIESDLNELLAKFFVGSGEIYSDTLLDPRKRGSFDLNTKIQLAYKLGLISHRLKTHLDMVRTFRNDCAHLEDDFDFEEPNNRSRIRSAYLELNDIAQNTFPHSNDKEKFQTICSLSILMLQSEIDTCKKTREKQLETIYK